MASRRAVPALTSGGVGLSPKGWGDPMEPPRHQPGPSPPYRRRRHDHPAAPGGTAVLAAFIGYAGVVFCEAVLAGLLAAKAALASSWRSRLLWGGLLATGVAILRFPTGRLTRLVFDFSLGQGTLTASRRKLSLSWRVWFHRWERAWDAESIVALDEEVGTLCILADGRLDRFFDGRDPEEIRWAAEVLRSALGVPASPPPLTAEVPVRYRLAGWPEPLGGFALVEPGQLCLRPRFRLDAVLVLCPAEKERTFWSGGMPDGVAVERDDVAWGVADGGQRVRLAVHAGRGAGRPGNLLPTSRTWRRSWSGSGAPWPCKRATRRALSLPLAALVIEPRGA
ncbi:MAG: hypothetical protein U0797_19245 [Gemmataceae bacterium]